MKDLIHEARIRFVFFVLRIAESVRNWSSTEFVRLINSRSPAQVTRMERSKGLV